jgi:hypothetical protein
MTTCSYVDEELSYVLHYAVDYMPVLRLYYDMNIYLMHISSHWTFSNEVPLAGVLFRVRTDYLVVWVTGGEASGSDLAVHDDDSAVDDTRITRKWPHIFPGRSQDPGTFLVLL